MSKNEFERLATHAVLCGSADVVEAFTTPRARLAEKARAKRRAKRATKTAVAAAPIAAPVAAPIAPVPPVTDDATVKRTRMKRLLAHEGDAYGVDQALECLPLDAVVRAELMRVTPDAYDKRVNLAWSRLLLSKTSRKALDAAMAAEGWAKLQAHVFKISPPHHVADGA